jgi:small nuclear ribonucleoprotein (snRNP)-like protein
MKKQRGAAGVSILVALAAILVILAAGAHLLHETHDSSEKFETPYQAVLLANGSVYFGHLSGYGGHTPVLTDVFYIVSQTDPNTKAVSNVLVKRGKELHEPDRMYLSPNQIIFVEPVGKDSKVAQLIAQEKH